MKLNCIDAKVFPLPHNITSLPPSHNQQPPSQSEPAPTSMSPQQGSTQPQSASRLAGSNLMKYNLRPAARVDTVEHVDQALSVSDVQAELKKGLNYSLNSVADINFALHDNQLVSRNNPYDLTVAVMSPLTS